MPDVQFTTSDYQYMARALQLAKRAVNTTHPNPRVACVLVKNNEIIAEGWHARAGEDHAEIVALRQAGKEARGATAYVSLEPCSHTGRTPPCADALIESGISEVVIAMQDPNPVVSGSGIKMLTEAGIKVRTGLLQQQAMELNRGFVKRMKLGLPWVTIKLAASIDGRTAMDNGESKWITGPHARADVQKMRAASSAILTGSGTVLADDPSLTVRIKNAERQPLRVVLDSYLSIPDSAKILNDGLPLLIATATDENDDRYQQIKNRNIDIRSFPAGNGRVELLSLLKCLAQQYSCNEIMVEAGSVVCGSLLENKLVDEIVLYQAPLIMGSSAKGLFDLPGLDTMAKKIHLSLKDCRAVGQDWRLTLTPDYQKGAE